MVILSLESQWHPSHNRQWFAGPSVITELGWNHSIMLHLMKNQLHYFVPLYSAE